MALAEKIPVKKTMVIGFEIVKIKVEKKLDIKSLDNEIDRVILKFNMTALSIIKPKIISTKEPIIPNGFFAFLFSNISPIPETAKVI